MDVRLLRKVVEEASRHGLREIIPSTMGEPLLYSEFDEILSLCREFNVRLNLTTNGTFPRRPVADWARLIVPVASDVKISWNGATARTAELIMKGARFDAVLENIRQFARVRDEIGSEGGNRCRLTLQMTFMESNSEELPDIIRLAASLGVERVKGHHLWVHFSETADLSMRRDSAAIQRWNSIVNRALDAADMYRLPSGEKVLLDNIFPLDSSIEEIAPDAACPFLGKEAWVSAEGRFNPCCAPDALRRTLGEFGNLNDGSLMEIWTSPGYRNLQQSYLTRDLCRTCNMRRPSRSQPPGSSMREHEMGITERN